MKARDLIVEPCLFKDVRAFIEKHHYSKSVNGVKVSQCFAVRHEKTLVGAVLYGAMSTTAWKKFAAKENEVVELRRLVLLDEAPKNSESKTVGATLRWFAQNRPETKLVVSYADPAHGHSGVIYKAANFKYLGTSAKDTGWYDPTNGKTYHSRALRTRDSHGRYKPFVLRLRDLQTSGGLQRVVLPGKHCYVYRLKNKTRSIKNAATMQSQRCDADHAASLIHHPVNRKHTMDLNILFENIGSIATSLERIADTMERRAEASPAEDPVQHQQAQHQPQVPSAADAAPAPEEKPKRTRRTKAELEAAAAAESAAAAPAAAAPAVAAPAVAAPAPAVAAPAAAALPRPIAGVGEAYHVYGVQDQFTQLNLLVGPYFVSAPSVKAVLTDTLAAHGAGLPLSDASDPSRQTPGANYTGMSNAARIEVYENCARAIDAHNAANTL